MPLTRPPAPPSSSSQKEGRSGASANGEGAEGNGNGENGKGKGAALVDRSKITVLRPGAKARPIHRARAPAPARRTFLFARRHTAPRVLSAALTDAHSSPLLPPPPNPQGALDGWSPDTTVATSQRPGSSMDEIVKRLGIKIEAKLSVTPEKALQFAGCVRAPPFRRLPTPGHLLGPPRTPAPAFRGRAQKTRSTEKASLLTLRPNLSPPRSAAQPRLLEGRRPGLRPALLAPRRRLPRRPRGAHHEGAPRGAPSPPPLSLPRDWKSQAPPPPPPRPATGSPGVSVPYPSPSS